MGSPRPVPLTLSPISAPGRTDRTGAAGTPDSFRYRYPSHETGFPPCHPTSFLHHRYNTNIFFFVLHTMPYLTYTRPLNNCYLCIDVLL